MKFVPLLRCGDMPAAVDFYTRLLGFEICDGDRSSDAVVDLRRGEAVLQLSTFDGCEKIAVNVLVDDVDSEWAEMLQRGYAPPDRPESPVHRGPIDQTWGSREFYIDDPDGNTLRFRS